MSAQITVGAQGLTTLGELGRLVQVAESLGFPGRSEVTVSAVLRSLTISTSLSYVTLPDEVEPDPCVDSACTLGEHGDESKHFDGSTAW